MLSDIPTEDLVAELAERADGLIVYLLPKAQKGKKAWFGAKWEAKPPHCLHCFLAGMHTTTLAYFEFPECKTKPKIVRGT